MSIESGLFRLIMMTFLVSSRLPSGIEFHIFRRLQIGHVEIFICVVLDTVTFLTPHVVQEEFEFALELNWFLLPGQWS